MNRDLSPAATQAPTHVRFGVLGFACSLSMITYLDRVCFGTVAPAIQSEFGIAQMTARRVLTELRAAGLAQMHPGVGTFVSELPKQPE